MKSNYLVITLIGLGMAACGQQSQNTETAPVVDTTTVAVAQPQVDSTAVEEAPVEDDSATEAADIELLKQFYKKCVFVFATSSPKKYCTQKCLKKLAAAYDYEGGGYAVWEFRTENQDGDGPSKVTDVQPAGDGWYTVSYRDMGAKGVTKVLVVDGKIDDYKRVK